MSHRKIRIIGSSGSGKSTLATMVSKKYNILSYDLDDIYFERKYDIKRDKESRKGLLQNIVAESSWIIEGVYASEWVHESFEQADIILYCKVSKINLMYRLLKREIKKGNKITHIIGLIRYALNYSLVTEELVGVLEKYKHKIIYVDTSKHLHLDDITLTNRIS